MGTIHHPLPVKLFIGMLSPEPSLLDSCTEILKNEFGPLDHESALLPWNRTDYYRDEMGPDILRKFLFFERIIDPGRLPPIKRFTNAMENSWAVQNGPARRRRINLDPGYVTEAKVVLATTKDFAHRLYIGEDIYAEVTLRYNAKQRSFAPHEYTFPDYRTEDYLALFNRARIDLRASLNKTGRQV
jgi:hypothetical protein